MVKIEKPTPSPRAGHRIKVVTSTRSSRIGRNYEEEEEEDTETDGMDLRALINKSKEGKLEGQRSVYCSIGGLVTIMLYELRGAVCRKGGGANMGIFKKEGAAVSCIRGSTGSSGNFKGGGGENDTRGGIRPS